MYIYVLLNLLLSVEKYLSSPSHISYTILFHSLLTLSKATCDIYLFRLTGHHACIVIL